jgi:gamma-glutamyltranspeptidase/glutathione hydrolase
MQSGYPHTVTEELRVEGRVPPETIEALRKKGHDVRVIGSWEGIGSAGMIQIHPETGVFMAAIDPRRDGHAAAW